MKFQGMTFYRAAAITNREKVRQQKWMQKQQRKQANAGKGKKNG